MVGWTHMIRTGAALAAGLALSVLAAASAEARSNVAPAAAFAPEYGDTLPPIGYVSFCARHRDDCQPVGYMTPKARIDSRRWDLLRQVNRYVNRKIRPVTDLELYNRPEVWEYPTTAGDCEDYVLLKKKYLEGLGFPPETLLITVVLDEKGGGHAVLMVRTTKGDFILDNRRDAILPWNKTGYTLLKRQSQQDPRRWVSLTRRPGQGKGMRIFGNN